MTRDDPADYVAAAIAYALVNHKLATSSDVRNDVIVLLQNQFGVALPREVIVPALEILDRENVIQLNQDRYFPLVCIPSDLGSRVAKWRFLDEKTSASSVFNRFSDGPYDWMKTVLQSRDFLRDLSETYPPSGAVSVPPSNEVESSEDERTQADVQAGVQQAQINPQVAVNINNVVGSVSPIDDVLARSAKNAGWFGSWGTWIGVILTIVSILVALFLAGKI